MAIQYFLTDVGRDIALNATSLGLNVSLSHIGVGTAKYDPLTALDRTTLVAEVERYPLNGGGVEPNSHTLRFVTSIEPTITVDGFEIGIFTDTGALFAIASTTGNDPLIRLVANIVAISSFGMILSTINLTNLIITVDPNTPICVALMNQHLDHPDPHPQYASKLYVNDKINDLSKIIPWRMYFGDVNQPDDLSQSNNTNTLISIASNSGEKYGGSTIITGTGNVSVSNILPLGGLEVHGALDNTLTSTATNAALTAAQGKVLNDLINNLQQQIDANASNNGNSNDYLQSLITALQNNKYDKTGGELNGNILLKGYLELTGGRTVAKLYAADCLRLELNYPLLINNAVNVRNVVSATDLTVSDNGSTSITHSNTQVEGNFVRFSSSRDEYVFDKPVKISGNGGGWLEIMPNYNYMDSGFCNFFTNSNIFNFDGKPVFFGVDSAGNPDGYTSLPNGKLLQFGTAIGSNGLYVTFPIAFPRGLFVIQVTDRDGSNVVGYNNESNIGFNMTTNVGTMAFSWIAIGW